MKLLIGNKNFSSWSLRPWLGLKHFAIPFEEVLIPLDQPDTPKRILELSPSGKVPALIDGSIRIWESLAILEYLAEKFPAKSFWPRDVAARAHARSVSHEMHAGFAALRTRCPMKVRERLSEFDSSVAKADISRIDEIWSGSRKMFGASGPYLFGEFSIADCMFAPVVFRWRTYGFQMSPASSEYCETMLRHLPMQEWAAAAEIETHRMSRYDKK